MTSSTQRGVTLTFYVLHDSIGCTGPMPLPCASLNMAISGGFASICLHTQMSQQCLPAGRMDAVKSGGCSSSTQPSRRLLPNYSKGLGCGGSRNYLPSCTVLWRHCVHGLSSQDGQAGEGHTTVMAGTCDSLLSSHSSLSSAAS